MAVGWLAAAGFVRWRAVAVDCYLDRVTATRFMTETLTTPSQRVPQAIAPDGQVSGRVMRSSWRKAGRGRLPEALNFIRAGIQRVPDRDRERLVEAAAELFRRQGSEGEQQADALLGLLKC